VYEDTHHDVPPGSLLILYTDGMVEDRSTVLDLEQGITMLSRAVHNADGSLDKVCDAFMAARPTKRTSRSRSGASEPEFEHGLPLP
jgi:serine phosphatase RsbU (regulator of sigma subunit)